jgi:hypothetical protein
LYERYFLQEDLLSNQSELALAEARILEIEQQRADLDFLQTQLDLLDLISEYGLAPAEILGDMELGLDANLEDLLSALSNAMEEIIATVNEGLGIESPSKEFMRIGEQAMAGLALGIERMMSLPIAASQIATNQMVDNSRSVSLTMPGMVISDNQDMALFEARVRHVVNNAIRGM